MMRGVNFPPFFTPSDSCGKMYLVLYLLLGGVGGNFTVDLTPAAVGRHFGGGPSRLRHITHARAINPA